MPIGITVKGGTNAGWRRVYPPRQAWICPSCNHELAAHWTRCPECGERRGHE